MNNELCLKCGNPIHIAKFSDGYYGIVEIDKKCFYCGYHYNWAYGKEKINNIYLAMMI